MIQNQEIIKQKFNASDDVWKEWLLRYDVKARSIIYTVYIKDIFVSIDNVLSSDLVVLQNITKIIVFIRLDTNCHNMLSSMLRVTRLILLDMFKLWIQTLRTATKNLLNETSSMLNSTRRLSHTLVRNDLELTNKEFRDLSNWRKRIIMIKDENYSMRCYLVKKRVFITNKHVFYDFLEALKLRNKQLADLSFMYDNVSVNLDHPTRIVEIRPDVLRVSFKTLLPTGVTLYSMPRIKQNFTVNELFLIKVTDAISDVYRHFNPCTVTITMPGYSAHVKSIKGEYGSCGTVLVIDGKPSCILVGGNGREANATTDFQFF